MEELNLDWAVLLWFVVDNGEDRNRLTAALIRQNIDPPPVYVYEYAHTPLPGIADLTYGWGAPHTVMNVLLLMVTLIILCSAHIILFFAP